MIGVEEVSGDSLSGWPKGESLYCGYYINELTLKLLPRADPHEDIFVMYNQTLNQLSADPY